MMLIKNVFYSRLSIDETTRTADRKICKRITNTYAAPASLQSLLVIFVFHCTFCLSIQLERERQ